MSANAMAHVENTTCLLSDFLCHSCIQLVTLRGHLFDLFSPTEMKSSQELNLREGVLIVIFLKI